MSVLTNQTKNTATVTNQTKNSAIVSNQSKNTTTPTNQTKNTATPINQTKRGGFILLETGFYLLKEDSGRIALEGTTLFTHQTKN